MKKTLSILLSIILVFPCVFSVSASALGDVDANGRLEAEDARIALRMAVGLEEYDHDSEKEKAADADKNGIIEAYDARLILRAVVGLEPFKDNENPAGSDNDPGENGNEPGENEPAKLSSKEIYKLARTYTFEIQTETSEYSAIGSGFALTADGEIVTNYHVVENADSIAVFDYDGKEYTVTGVVAYDRYSDIAVIKVEETLTPAVLCRTGYETGDTVYTLGSSNGYTGTFANGVISNSSIQLSDYKKDMTFIQTSAPISGGNSGGPLIDEYGRVVGINTLTDTEGQNLNFAIPVSYLDKLDRSNPMTVEEFSKAEFQKRVIELVFGEDSVNLRVGGTAAYAFGAISKQDMTLDVRSSTDRLKVGIYHNKNDEYGFLYVSAAGTCKNATVTVYVKEAPDVKYELSVTVSADGDAAFQGTGGAPDFGALNGVAPSSFEFQPTYSVYPVMTYDGSQLLKSGKKADAIREEYEAELKKAGYVYSETQISLLGSYVYYIYTNAKTGITVIYAERKTFGRLSSVSITLY